MPLEHLVLKHTATPLNLDRVTELVPLARTEDWDPILVTGMGWTWEDPTHPTQLWRIQRGRHRYLAAMAAGRADILCRDVG